MTVAKKQILLKVICLVLALVLAAIAGVSFYDQRHYKETVVVSDALTEVRWLSDYVPMLKGTYGDTPIFIFDSGVEGGSVLYCGGTHPPSKPRATRNSPCALPFSQCSRSVFCSAIL